MSPPRSYLFVPGDRPDRFAKARASGAGCVVLDLEDAVAPDAKEAARGSVLRLPPRGNGPQLLVRVNAADTTWHAADLDAAEALIARRAIDGIMLPKAEAAPAAAATGRLGGIVVALMETVAGLVDLRALAAVPGIARIAFGSVDFCADAGILGDREELAFVRGQLVIESRHAGLPAPVDGVTLALDDAEALASDVRRARSFGFGAKLCVHPRQVTAVEAGFAPSETELAWARRVRAAASSGAATAVDGKLVDRPVLERAAALLAEASAHD